MKRNLLFLLSSLLIVFTVRAQSTCNIPLNQGYAENEYGHQNKVRYSGRWLQKGYFPTFYIHFPKGHFEIESKNEGLVSVSSCDPEELLLKEGTLKSFCFDADHEGWYRFCCSEGTPNRPLYPLTVKSQSDISRVFRPNFYSSPSLHLNTFASTDPDVPAGCTSDWFYDEVQIPKDANITCTYLESLGFHKGYMGIQVNGPMNHDIIFSVWDDGDTDSDPNLATFKKSGTISYASDDDVVVERFGNEGTGGKVMIRGEKWVPGQWVRFLVNTRPEEVCITTKNNLGHDTTFLYHNTIISAWYQAVGIDDNWHFIACHRQAGCVNYFGTGHNSFLENYGGGEGQAKRKGYYRRIFTHDMGTGRWFNRNKFTFGHTDGGNEPGKRNDRYQTAVENYEGEPAFFMQSGGFIEPYSGKKEVPLMSPVGIVPLDYQLDSLVQKHVLPAIQQQDEDRMDKSLLMSMDRVNLSDWHIHSCSSQNYDAPAQNAIDGRINTMWHTQWQGGSPNYPHYIAIEKNDDIPCEVSQIILHQGRAGGGYCAGEISLHSKSGRLWKPFMENIPIERKSVNVIKLDKPRQLSDLKIVFERPYEGCNKFIALHELELLSPNAARVRDIAQKLLDNADSFNGYPAADLEEIATLLATPKVTTEQLTVALKKVARSSKLNKYCPIYKPLELAADRAYHLFNAYGYGTLLAKDNSVVLANVNPIDDVEANASLDRKIAVQDPCANWMFVPCPKPRFKGAYYIYNIGTHQFLSISGRRVSMVSNPTPIYVEKYAEGFTLSLLPSKTKAITLNPVRSGSRAITVLGNPPRGVFFKIWDNFSLRPSFGDVMEFRKITDTLTDDIDVVDAEHPIDNIVYDLQGRRIQQLSPGIYISNGKKFIVK